ncbi:MAG: stage II sporulation protein M [Bacillota bacterium]|nr:stage II sporulation protein M [Bacillota bacterium]
MNRSEKNRVYRIWLYLFLGSFLTGVLIMNMADDILLGEEGIFSTTSINRLKYIEIDEGSFFRYVLRQRMGGCIVMLVLSTTVLGMIAAYAVVLWQGIMTGMVITAAAIRYGIKGILLILGGMFPHQCLLIPAGVMLLGWCLENYSRIHICGKGVAPCFRNKRQQFLHQGLSLMWILLVLFIGCILESYVNPILICDLVKIF